MILRIVLYMAFIYGVTGFDLLCKWKIFLKSFILYFYFLVCTLRPSYIRCLNRHALERNKWKIWSCYVLNDIFRNISMYYKSIPCKRNSYSNFHCSTTKIWLFVSEKLISFILTLINTLWNLKILNALCVILHR